MTRATLYPKVALDLFWVQLTWTFWFLGIMTVINLVRLTFGMNSDSLFSGIYIASNIYMLVIGIIAINFLPYYVEHGVTRKDYFMGNMIASLGISIALPILAYLINLIENLFFNHATHLGFIESTLNEVIVDLDGNLLGEIIVSFILTPTISLEDNIIMSLCFFGLNLFVFYLAGWLISAAFYRLGVIAGILMIAVAIIIVGMKDSMLRIVLDTPLFETFSALSIVPKGFALPVVAITIMITIMMIRLLTKRAAIKI